MKSDVEALVSAAKEGNKHALEELVLQIQDKIYGLALRMLYDPSDAQDASQEILLKIITHLGTFRGESAFTTWMYRVAANHLLTTRKRRAEREAMSFEAYEEDLEIESARNWQASQSDILQHLFVKEIRISCLQGLLLCLDRAHRLSWCAVLLTIFALSMVLALTMRHKGQVRASRQLGQLITVLKLEAPSLIPSGRSSRSLAYQRRAVDLRHGPLLPHHNAGPEALLLLVPLNRPLEDQ